MPIISYRQTNLPTPFEIKDSWCFGLPLTNEYGRPISDHRIRQFIDGARRRVERHVGILFKPTVICTRPSERNLIKGTDYEIAEPAYDYDAKAYRQWGFLQLRERPVQELFGLQLVLPNGQVIVDFMTRKEWIKLYSDTGQIHIVPYAGDATLFHLLGGSQSGFPFVTGRINQNLPQMWYVDYVAGYKQKEIPEDIRNMVAKIAAVDVLGITGDALLAGIASASTSMDGLSESFATTASATSATYGAHIKQYQDEIDTFFDEKKSGVRSSERGLTFTVL